VIFDSPEFFVFFALFLGAYAVLQHKWQNRLILVASYIFYGWWDWRFCGLLFLSTFIDWYLGLKIGQDRRRAWVVVSVVVNLGILGFFKYFNFFIENAEILLASMGFQYSWPFLQIILPVGISFYTFQSMAYTIDVYRGDIKPVRSLADFAAFVAFWPQLVAGPILRADCLIPQIQRHRRVTPRMILEGIYMILVGLVKKVCIADVIGQAIQPVMATPTDFSSWQLLLAAQLFAFRIYCDFSGYSDIARGCSRILGFHFPENFDHPYFSTSISDFWRRWHVSLSSWLRDYLYKPLGGSRHGGIRTSFNLLVVMVVAGLWHGASWNYVSWGFLQGALLVGDRLLLPITTVLAAGAYRHCLGAPWRVLCRILTFHLFAFGLVIFVIREPAVQYEFFQRLLQWTYTPDPARFQQVLWALGLFLAFELPEWRHKNRFYLRKYPLWVQTLVFGLMIATIFVCWTSSYEPFIYFQF
jgi:alginate O-acetyltransferase complex protein AlgI